MYHDSLCFFVAVALQAKVSLPAFFSDGMVMQQQSQASLWGKASKGKIVEVTTGWDGQTYTTRADEQGKWKLTVQTPAAGGPYDITLMMVNALGLRIFLWVNYGFVRGRAIWRCL